MTRTTPPENAAETARRMGEIDAALGVSDMPRAVRLARSALDHGISHPMLYNLVAFQLEQEGKLDESIVQLELGLEAWPQDVQLLTTLGFSHLAFEQRPAAADVFQRTAALHPNYAPARYGLGSAYALLGELELAQTQYERAVTIAPDYADAWGGLADIAERRHARDDARKLIARALAIDPRHMDARLQLARIESAEGNGDIAERMLRQILEDPNLSAAGRGHALVLLGDILERLNRKDEAWDAYVAGKAQHRRTYSPIYEKPGLEGARARVERMTEEFAQTDPKDWTEPTSAAARGDVKTHGFLFGFARSGTTLLEQILVSNPLVTALEERPTLYDAKIEFTHTPGGLLRFAALHGEAVDGYRKAYWERVIEFGGDTPGKVFIDKFPLNTYHAPMIQKLFPDAKLLFALRDPRDVVLSCFRRGFSLNPAMYEFTTIEGAARYYDAVMTAAKIHRERLSLNMHVVRYEAMIADFEGEVRKICAFLDLDWIDEMKNFAETAKKRPVRTPSASQVARGLYKEGMEQWRAYARQLEPVADILAPWIAHYGYPAD